MKKRFLLTVCVQVAVAVALWAVPAKRSEVRFTQPDGKVITLSLRGDECFHYRVLADGMPVKRGEDGSFYYALFSGDSLQVTGTLAHEAADRSADEIRFVNENRAEVQRNIGRVSRERMAQRNARRVERMKAGRAVAQKVGTPSGTEGRKKGLVILVNFSDVKMKAAHTQAAFNDMMNKEGYNENGNIGSVRDYFKAQSYGKLTIDFDVVGPVNLANGMAYYGENSGYYEDDVRPGQMVAEACKAVDSQVNFSDYDWDGDGYVDQVYVVYAGYGEAAVDAPANAIWPHEWLLEESDYGKKLYLDNVYINTYACSSELNGSSGSKMEGIGTMCHEFSHCLGLPDFYDTNGNSFGMDSWSLMDYGCYNGDGYVPSAYTSYERMYSGWLEPKVLDAPCKIEGMQPITSAPEAYIIYNDGNRNEYYLLENHQNESWDSEAYAHGLMVLHVDYDENAWKENTVNNVASRQRMAIIPADNSLKPTEASLKGDLFPGTVQNNSLTDYSQPAARLYNKNSNGSYLMGKPIEDISETQDGLISLTFMGGVFVEAPEALAATAVTNNSFTANWSAIDGAVSYVIELKEKGEKTPEECVVLSEDFSGFEVTGSDGSDDISAWLDDYMALGGWTGSKLFESSQRVKIGSSKYDGYLITPVMNVPESENVTVSFWQDVYGTIESTTMTVKLLDANGRTVDSKVLDVSGGKYTTVFSGVKANYKIGFYPLKRVYLKEVKVYDGEFAVDELFSTKARVSANEVTVDAPATSHAFTGLTGNAYTYKVKAVTEEGESAWSNKMEVTLQGSGIAEIPVGEDGDAEYYNLQGVRVLRTQNGEPASKLSPGIYLMRKNGKTVKVIVK